MSRCMTLFYVIQWCTKSSWITVPAIVIIINTRRVWDTQVLCAATVHPVFCSLYTSIWVQSSSATTAYTIINQWHCQKIPYVSFESNHHLQTAHGSSLIYNIRHCSAHIRCMRLKFAPSRSSGAQLPRKVSICRATNASRVQTRRCYCSRIYL